MFSALKSFLFLIAVVAVSACVGQSNIQGTASQFSQATLTAASAEDAFLADVNKTGATANNALVREQWIRKRTSLQPESLDAPKPVISPAAANSIGTLVDAIRLYGQALQALAADGATTSLGQNATTLVSSLQGLDQTIQALAVPGKPPVLASSQVNFVVAGINNITGFVLGKIIARDVEQAASARGDDLKAIVGALKLINVAYGGVAADNFDAFKLANLAVLRSPASNLTDFNALTTEIVQARAQADPAKVNAALDALVQANTAVATAGPGGALAQVQGFAQAATNAYNFYAAAAK